MYQLFWSRVAAGNINKWFATRSHDIARDIVTEAESLTTLISISVHDFETVCPPVRSPSSWESLRRSGDKGIHFAEFHSLPRPVFCAVMSPVSGSL